VYCSHYFVERQLRKKTIPENYVCIFLYVEKSTRLFRIALFSHQTRISCTGYFPEKIYFTIDYEIYDFLHFAVFIYVLVFYFVH